MGVRRKITTKKSVSKDFPEVDNKFYPFVSGKAKVLFTDCISKKPIIEERSLVWDEDCGKKEIARIIYNISRKNLERTSLQTQEKGCNLEDRKDDHVFVRGGWVEFNEWVIDETLQNMVVEDDEFEKFMTEELDIKYLLTELCQKPYEVSWTVCKKGTILAFQLQCHGAHVHSITKIHLFEDYTHQA